MEAYVEATWVVPLASNTLIAIGIALMIGIPALGLLGCRLWKRIHFTKPRLSRSTRTISAAYRH